MSPQHAPSPPAALLPAIARILRHSYRSLRTSDMDVLCSLDKTVDRLSTDAILTSGCLGHHTMSNTTAFHGSDNRGSHVVGMWELHVVIVPDGNHWFAQGLEIDYGTAGESLEAAKEKFQSGLAATVHEHLKVYGCIDGLLRVAPQEAWDLAFAASAKPHEFSQVSTHQIAEQSESALPFRGIQFIQQQVAA